MTLPRCGDVSLQGVERPRGARPMYQTSHIPYPGDVVLMPVVALRPLGIRFEPRKLEEVRV